MLAESVTPSVPRLLCWQVQGVGHAKPAHDEFVDFQPADSGSAYRQPTDGYDPERQRSQRHGPDSQGSDRLGSDRSVSAHVDRDLVDVFSSAAR
jgi:hypothetical protein